MTTLKKQKQLEALFMKILEQVSACVGLKSWGRETGDGLRGSDASGEKL